VVNISTNQDLQDSPSSKKKTKIEDLSKEIQQRLKLIEKAFR